MPVFLPGASIRDVTAPAARKVGKVKRLKPCRCGCGDLTYATYVVGHSNPRAAAKIRERREKLSRMPFDGAGLRAAREEAGYTRDLLSKKLGIPRTTLKEWENDRRIVPDEAIDLLIGFFPSLRRNSR